jgi:hypothetical protein
MKHVQMKIEHGQTHEHAHTSTKQEVHNEKVN